MRYSHNITIDKSFTDKEWHLIETAFNRLINNLPKYSKSAGANYRHEIVKLNDILVGEISKGDRRISFNGKNQQDGSQFIRRSAHDFCLTQKLRGKDFNDEIDTERFPYDLVVCAMLFFLKLEFPDNVFIHSDGNTSDWRHPVHWTCMVLYRHQYAEYQITDQIAQLNWLEINPCRTFKRFQAVLDFEVRIVPTTPQHNIFTDRSTNNQWFY